MPEADDDTTGTDADAASPPEEEAKPARRKVDPQADVAARRAATKARMDEDRASGGGTATKATADDPTGAKARRAARRPGDKTDKGDKTARSEPMAKARADDPTGARARKEEKATTGKVARPSKRTGGSVDPKAARAAAARSGNPKKSAAAADSSRYTAPIPRSQLESPTWVPVLMFTLLGVGAAVILLTYVAWGGRPLTLGIGLALILGGIMTATQYR